MNQINKSLTIIFSLMLTILVSFFTWADKPDDIRSLVGSGKILPLEQILINLRKIAKGDVIEVELESKKQKLIYEIELLAPNGVVTEYIFDAKTGKLLKQKVDD